jgi:hypothetical protein
VPHHSLYSLLGFWIQGEVWEVNALKVKSDGWKIHHFLMITVVQLLVLWNSKLSFSKHFSCLCNCVRFIWEVSTMGGGLPAWLDGAWCCWHLVVSSASSPWSASISICLSGVKNFWMGTSGFDCNWGSLTPVADVVGFLALLSVSSVKFPLLSS